MKTKFETNVAAEMPKTKSKEPTLPWKLSDADLERIGPQDEEYKSAVAETPPLKTRGVYLVMLVLAIFAFAIYLITNTVAENEDIRTDALRKETRMASLTTTLEKVTNEKNMLSANAMQLEKRVNDLVAQKELFTSVIESLTKTSDEVVVISEKKGAQNTPVLSSATR